MTSQSYYDILGVECTASLTEIKRAYNSLALQTHPDKLPHSSIPSPSLTSSSCHSNPNPESLSEGNVKAIKEPNVTFHMVHVAYKTLMDVSSRKKYDAEISASGSMGTPHIVIDLDDMVYSNSNSQNGDVEQKSGEGDGRGEEGSGGSGGNGVYGYPCRCGDEITISEDELEKGVEIVECTGCSLRAKIVYFVVED